ALGRGYTPSAPPVGCKLFDSFSRADQTYAHSRVPDFGSIEYSNIGTAQRWNTNSVDGNSPTVPSPRFHDGLDTGDVQNLAVGVYNRSAVPLDLWQTVAWVNSNSGNQRVEVTRRSQIGTASDGTCALIFRLQDSSHFWLFQYSRVIQGDGT